MHDMADKRRPPLAAHDRLEVLLQKGVLGGALLVARHWLLTANLVLALFVSLPVLAPLLMSRGHQEAASVIYSAYRLVCHQEPQRSYFLGGPYMTYSASRLESLLGEPAAASFTGSPVTGYKMAYCERDTATYLAILAAGLILAVSGRRLPRLPLRVYFLLLAPIVLDGTTQLLGLRESTWLLRTFTGGLFGLATAWLLYPEVDAALRNWVARVGSARGA